MAKERSLKIVIAGDADKLDREVGRANRSLDSLGKQTRLTASISSKGFSAMRVGATGFAAAAAGAVIGVKAVTQAAIESEKSQAKLQAQLKASGISYKAHAKEIDAVIQKTSQLAGLDDEQLQDAFTAIIRTTGSVSQSMKLVGLAADIARAKHIDVAKAGELVAKVAGGNTGILKRYGVAVKDGATAQEALAAAQQKFAGQAKAYGDTTGGAVDRAGVAFENLQETIGGKLAPVVADAANGIARFVNEMQAGTGAGGRFRRVVEGIGGAVGDAAKWIGRATGDARDFVRSFARENRTQIASVISTFRQVGRIAQDVFNNVLAPAFRFAEAAAKRAFPGIKTAIQGAAKVIKGVVDVISGIMHGDFARAFGGMKGIVSGAVKGALGSLRALTAPARELASQIGHAIVDGIVGVVKGAGSAVAGAIKSIIPGPIRGLLSKAGGAAGSVASALGFNSGGRVPGRGRGDIVPAMLEPGEFIMRKQVVDRFGPTFFNAINSGQAPQMRAGGGVIGPGTVNKMQSAARGWVGLPYVYGGGHGGFGPSGGGFDCSGFVSAVLGVGGAIGSPMAVRQPLQGALVPGPGKYVTVGIRGSSGRNAHTAIKVGSRFFEAAGRGVVEAGGWRGAFDLFHPSNEASGSAKAEDPGQADGSGGGAAPSAASKAQKAGSRIVNKIISGTSKAVQSATGRAAAIGGVIEQADSGYGRTERLYGQVLGGVPGAFGEEDLGTASGRSQRTTELQQLKSLKKDQLARMRKRMAALSKAIAARTKTLKSLRKARDKAHGSKRAKIIERIKPYEDRLIDLQAELAALGGQISDTELDIGDLDKEIGEVSTTPDTAADAGDQGPSTTDKVSQELAHIAALERAGDISPEQSHAAQIQTLQSALGGAFGALTDEEALGLRGDLREATSALTQATVDNTQALTDLKRSIDEQLAFANSVSAVTSMQAVRAMSDVISGQLGYRVSARASMPGSGALARL